MASSRLATSCGRPVPSPTSSTPFTYGASAADRGDVHAVSNPSSARCPAVAAATPSSPITATRTRPDPGRVPAAPGAVGALAAGAAAGTLPPTSAAIAAASGSAGADGNDPGPVREPGALPPTSAAIAAARSVTV